MAAQLIIIIQLLQLLIHLEIQLAQGNFSSEACFNGKPSIAYIKHAK